MTGKEYIIIILASSILLFISLANIELKPLQLSGCVQVREPRKTHSKSRLFCEKKVNKTVRVVVYVICHDDASEATARGMCNRWSNNFTVMAYPLRIFQSSKYYENEAYDLMLGREQEWHTSHYVGLVTHTFDYKMKKDFPGFHVDWESIAARAQRMGDDAWAMLPVMHAYTKRHWKQEKPISMLEFACFKHGMNFYRAWIGLLVGHMGLTEVQALAPGLIYPFYSNWWFARPTVMSEYITFYRKARRELESDAQLLDISAQDSFYSNERMTPDRMHKVFDGRDYFPLHAFLFERLPPLFAHLHGIVVHRAGPTRQYTVGFAKPKKTLLGMLSGWSSLQAPA